METASSLFEVSFFSDGPLGRTVCEGFAQFGESCRANIMIRLQTLR